jgi:hypothetical protein
MPTLSRTTETLVSFVLAAAVLGAGSVALAPRGPALAVGAALALLGAIALVRGSRASRARRRVADEVIEILPTDRVPGKLRWRARELTTVRERRRLAGSLRSLLKTAADPFAAARSAVPLNRRAILRQQRALEEIAGALTDLRRPVSPRVVVQLRRLLQDGEASPLYSPEHAEELASRLARMRTLLGRPRDRRL